MKKILLLGVTLLSFITTAQKSINNYEYIVVPVKFDFQKRDNQHRINTITKFLFEKYGFKAVYSSNMPLHIKANPCKALHANVVDNSNVFTTKVRVEITDCNGKVLYTTPEAANKIKDYETAYKTALEEAFKDMVILNYQYESLESDPEEEITTDIKSEPTNKPEEKPIKIVKAENKQDSEEVLNKQPILKPNMLYAQPIENGYQLIDSTPKVVYIIKKTSSENEFIVTSGGILKKVNGVWILEFYEDNKLQRKQLNIKF